MSTKQQNWGRSNRLKLEKNHRWLVCEVVAVDDSGWPGSWQRNMTSTILHSEVEECRVLRQEVKLKVSRAHNDATLASISPDIRCPPSIDTL